MKGLTNNIVFIIAAWVFISAAAITAVSAAIVADVGDDTSSVAHRWDNPEVENADRDKSGTSRSSNFALVSQVKKKEAFTDKASLEAEREGFEPSRSLRPHTNSNRAPSTAQPPLQRFVCPAAGRVC